MFWFFKRKKSKKIKKQKHNRKNLGKKLSKTRSNFIRGLENLIKGAKKLDGNLFVELEELLITADVGVNATDRIIKRIEDEVSREVLKDPDQLRDAIKDEILKTLSVEENKAEATNSTKPYITLIVL